MTQKTEKEEEAERVSLLMGLFSCHPGPTSPGATRPGEGGGWPARVSSGRSYRQGAPDLRLLQGAGWLGSVAPDARVWGTPRARFPRAPRDGRERAGARADTHARGGGGGDTLTRTRAPGAGGGAERNQEVKVSNL